MKSLSGDRQAPAPTNSAPAGPRQLVPPDPRFWQRYSPHHEFPLSTVVTATFYGLLAAGLAVLFVFGARWFADKEPLPVEPIAFAGGGGGGDGGEGGNNGKGNDPKPPEEDIPDTADKQPDKLKPKVPLGDIPRTPIKGEDIGDIVSPQDTVSTRYYDNLATIAIGTSVQQDARKLMMEGLRGKPGTPGPGGDPGPGEPGKGKLLNDRQKRVLRWTMMFDTVNGADYVRQLAALGAFVAVPGPEGYQIIRDLKARPVVGKVEDLKSIQRIFWVDNRPESVRPLAEALGMRSVPDHIVAFFPKELEDELLKKELKFKGLKESEIKETRFKVMRRGTTYTPYVVDQVP